MLDYLSIDGLQLLDTIDGNGRRDVTRIEGLVGLAAPRESSTPAVEAEGSNSRARFQGSKIVTIEGECWGRTIADAYAMYDKLEAALYGTLRKPTGGVLRWTRALDDPSGAINLVTNPSFELNLDGWAAHASGGAAVGNFVSTGPLASTSGVRTGATVSQDPMDTGQVIGAVTNFPADQGTTYYFRATVLMSGNGVTAAANAMDIYLDWRAADGTLLQSSGAIAGARASGAIQTLIGTATAPVGAVRGQLYLRAGGPSTGVTTFRYDSVQATTTPQDYFDGDSPRGRWEGTPHSSRSILLLGPKPNVIVPPLQAFVKLAGPLDAPLEEAAARLSYQFQLEQMDPRAYAQTPTAVDSSPLSVGGGGLTFPMKFPLMFAASTGGSVDVVNSGTQDTPPTVRIYGPVTSPTYTLDGDPTAGQVIIVGDIASGDFLEIDHRARTVKLNGIALRMNLLNSRDSRFFSISPGAHTVRLSAQNFSAGAFLRVTKQDAYGG